jgi:hypothetical protein
LIVYNITKFRPFLYPCPIPKIKKMDLKLCAEILSKRNCVCCTNDLTVNNTNDNENVKTVNDDWDLSTQSNQYLLKLFLILQSERVKVCCIFIIL